MSSLTFVALGTAPGDVDHSRITDLALIRVDGVDHLYSTTRYDGVLRHWDIGGGSLAVGQDHDFAGSLIAGGVGGVTVFSHGTGSTILTGGGAGRTLQTITLDNDGSFAATAALGDLSQVFGGFRYGQSFHLMDGTQVVYGAVAGAHGLAQLRFAANGAFLGQTDPAINANGASQGITATARTATHLFSASASHNTVTSWNVTPSGGLALVQTIGADDNLWISAPTALETAQVGGVTYLVLAAAGSSSLSVMELGIDGSMIVRDHVMDTLTTRFGGVTSLAVVTDADKTYVIAGGADDGITVFLLLAGGLLVPRATIEDTVDFGLDNVSAIAARTRNDALDIYVASSSEVGVTQLRYDPGLPGVTLTAPLGGGLLNGTQGADILQGHAGDDIIIGGGGNDILRDGAGSDVMSGGAGADLFILSADGMTDTITDFTPGEDRIDLSLWPMLRDISQLSIRLRDDGMTISYGAETLIVQSADGAPIDYRTLTTADVLGAARLPSALVPGYPGPATPTPIIGQDTRTPPVSQGDPHNALTPLQIITAGQLKDLRDAFGPKTPAASPPDAGLVVKGRDSAEQLSGGAGFDVILAGGGNDIVQAGAGDDIIFGRSGNDMLWGEDGADTIMGGAGNDRIYGGNGHDLINGGDGNDILDGGFGDDILIGAAGADTFIFSGGADQIMDFQQGVDQIVLDPRLWTGLTSAEDLLFLYGSFAAETAVIDFGDGNRLTIRGLTDATSLADDISLF